MELAWIATRIVACLTWVTFGICMRWYFRRAREANRAKRWLIRAAGASTLAQLAALALVQPPILSLMLAGLACFAAGNVLYWWALAAHGKDRPAFAFLPAKPTALTAAGPYGLVRHPIYAAYLICWVAGALSTGQVWLLGTVAVMGVLYYRAARQEETGFLTSPLAEQYRAYQGRTGMFLPRILPSAS
jgi:protein-S-isoprenylcysteine O-methyltransferase Ste14